MATYAIFSPEKAMSFHFELSHSNDRKEGNPFNGQPALTKLEETPEKNILWVLVNRVWVGSNGMKMIKANLLYYSSGVVPFY